MRILEVQQCLILIAVSPGISRVNQHRRNRRAGKSKLGIEQGHRRGEEVRVTHNRQAVAARAGKTAADESGLIVKRTQVGGTEGGGGADPGLWRSNRRLPR